LRVHIVLQAENIIPRSVEEEKYEPATWTLYKAQTEKWRRNRGRASEGLSMGSWWSKPLFLSDPRIEQWRESASNPRQERQAGRQLCESLQRL